MSTAAVSHKYTLQSLIYRYVFGLKGDVNGNVFYIDEANLIYPAGSNIIIYNTETKTQKFVPSGDASEGITAMAVKPSVAVILPTTAYLLRLNPPPVRKMINQGVPVALGSDFNPNAYCLSMV